jgi:hypothetical protein
VKKQEKVSKKRWENNKSKVRGARGKEDKKSEMKGQGDRVRGGSKVRE